MLDSQKLVGSGPVQPVRWLRLWGGVGLGFVILCYIWWGWF